MKSQAQTKADAIADVAASLQYMVAADMVLESLEAIRSLTALVPALVVDVLEAGMPTHTNKRMAEALGVSPRMLTGMREEVSRGNA